jgi:hypothetical protein
VGWAPDYVTPVELAAYVRLESEPSELGLAVTAASRAIDRTCKRQFGLADAPVPRIYTATVDATLGRWAVEVDDLATTEGLAVAVDTTEDGSFAEVVPTVDPAPRNAVADGLVWTRLVLAAGAAWPGGHDQRPFPWRRYPGMATGHHRPPAEVRVTARWGWPAVPDAVRQACLLQASRFLSRRDSPYGIAGSPDSGSEMRLLERLDPDVAVTLRAYRRRWWAA